MIGKSRAKFMRVKSGIVCFIVFFFVLTQSAQAGFFGSAGFPITNWGPIFPWHGRYIMYCKPRTPDVKVTVHRSLPISEVTIMSTVYGKEEVVNKDKRFLVHEFIDEEKTGRQILRGYTYLSSWIGWREFVRHSYDYEHSVDGSSFILPDNWFCYFSGIKNWNDFRKYNPKREEGKK